MHNLTPDWDEVCGELRTTLVESLEFLDDAIAEGADPMFVVASTVEELKLFIEAVEEDPANA